MEISTLMLYPTDQSKDILNKYKEMWIKKIRHVIRSIINSKDSYDKKYIKIKFNSDDDLPLNKTLKDGDIVVVVGPVFHESNKFCLPVFLDESLYKLG